MNNCKEIKRVRNIILRIPVADEEKQNDPVERVRYAISRYNDYNSRMMNAVKQP